MTGTWLLPGRTPAVRGMHRGHGSSVRHLDHCRSLRGARARGRPAAPSKAGHGVDRAGLPATTRPTRRRRTAEESRA